MVILVLVTLVCDSLENFLIKIKETIKEEQDKEEKTLTFFKKSEDKFIKTFNSLKQDLAKSNKSLRDMQK